MNPVESFLRWVKGLIVPDRHDYDNHDHDDDDIDVVIVVTDDDTEWQRRVLIALRHIAYQNRHIIHQQRTIIDQQRSLMGQQEDIDAAVTQLGINDAALADAAVRITDAIAALQAQGVDTTALVSAINDANVAVGEVVNIVPAPLEVPPPTE